MRNYYFKMNRIEYQNKILDTIDNALNDLSPQEFDILIERIQEYIDDLIERLKKVVSHSNKYSISLSVCGELASITDVATRLYSIGIRRLSVSPTMINHLNISYLKFKNE